MVAKKKTKKKKDKTDQKVFKEFGLGRDQKTLRKLVSSQRRINGRLYRSIELILEAFPTSKLGFTVDRAKLDKADKINEVVPGTGVGCVTPPDP
ncbi:MAG TPA: hypothetical protein VHE60_03045 [Pyrinomonadaceae bacterium]|nr:hypothetical protein [Pyrinomonadaceae bacterium]